MTTFTIAILLWFSISLGESGNLVQMPNGNYAITGNGCGINTEMKHFYHIPTNLADLECVLIQNQNGFIPFDAVKAVIGPK